MDIKDIIKSIKRKRNRGYKQGYIYVPYIMKESISIVSDNFKPSKKILNRYGCKGNSK